MSRFAKIDFFTDTSLVEDPVPYYDYLHAQGPVVRLPEHDCVAVVGFEEFIFFLEIGEARHGGAL